MNEIEQTMIVLAELSALCRGIFASHLIRSCSHCSCCVGVCVCRFSISLSLMCPQSVTRFVVVLCSLLLIFQNINNNDPNNGKIRAF